MAVIEAAAAAGCGADRPATAAAAAAAAPPGQSCGPAATAPGLIICAGSSAAMGAGLATVLLHLGATTVPVPAATGAAASACNWSGGCNSSAKCRFRFLLGSGGESSSESARVDGVQE